MGGRGWGEKNGKGNLCIVVQWVANMARNLERLKDREGGKKRIGEMWGKTKKKRSQFTGGFFKSTKGGVRKLTSR